jgi:hypothetical protein
MNLLWAAGLVGSIYALYHFFGPPSMVLLIPGIPIAIVIIVAMNCAANKMNKE